MRSAAHGEGFKIVCNLRSMDHTLVAYRASIYSLKINSTTILGHIFWNKLFSQQEYLAN